MARSNYHKNILRYVTRRYHLQDRYATHRSHRDGLYTAVVTVDIPIAHSHIVDSKSYASRPNVDEHNALEEAYHIAYTRLDEMGYKRKHFKTELSDIANTQSPPWRINFHDVSSGPQNQLVWTSQLLINGNPTRWIASASQIDYAQELVAQKAIESNFQ